MYFPERSEHLGVVLMASVGDRCVEHPVDHALTQNTPAVSAINSWRVNMVLAILSVSMTPLVGNQQTFSSVDGKLASVFRGDTADTRRHLRIAD
jgi:hypothetical protein